MARGSLVVSRQPCCTNLLILLCCLHAGPGGQAATLRGSILTPSPRTPRAEQRVPRLWATLIRVSMDALLAPARSCSAGGICSLLPPGLELHPALSPSLSASTRDHVQSHLWVLCCCSHSSRAWPVAQISPASWALSRGAQDGNPSSAAPLAITGKSWGVLAGTCCSSSPRGLRQQHPAKALASNAGGEGLDKCLAAPEGPSSPSSSEGPAVGVCPVPPVE